MFSMLAITTDQGMLVAAGEIAQQYWPLFWHGIKITLLISLTGTVIGLLIGLLVGGIRAVKAEPRDSLPVKVLKKIVQIVTSLYVEVFRGTPMIVQAMFIYYTFKSVFNWTPMVAGICIISVNTGAYMAEIVRAGIQSVDRGQYEAARSIGMTSVQAMLLVILPQAIRNSFPAIGNEFVVNIKDSSVLNVISLTDVYFQSMSVAGSVFLVQQTFLVTGAIYLVLTFTTTRILNAIEKRMGRPKSSFPASQTINNSKVIHQGGKK